MLHLFDGLFAPSLGEVLVAPVIQNAIVQPVLVDRREFVLQRSIEIFDNLFVAPHCLTPRVQFERRSLPQNPSPASALRLNPVDLASPVEENLPQRETRPERLLPAAPPSTRFPGHDEPLSDPASPGRGPAS